jgi:hypothetical protein
MMKRKHIPIQVLAADQLPKLSGRCNIIVNTDNQTLPGRHWVAIRIDSKKHGEFFDSYGQKPQVKNHVEFLKRNCVSWKYNKICLQSSFSSVCGHYCMLYHFARHGGQSLTRFINEMDLKNVAKNDARAIIRHCKIFGYMTSCSKKGQKCVCRSYI